MDDRLFQSLEWRCVGPPRGGRVVTVAGDPNNPAVFYFGACAGGVWKTYDAGTYWENISDGFFNTAAVGAIAVAASDPNVIYVGTGEACIRGDVSHGDGVYKSTDAGKTWVYLGLEHTRHIAKIRIHPTNPDIVYVAALGHAFGPNKERGIYRSVDGGQTWEHILFRSEKAGAVDLTLDVNNPRILYASMWEAYRNFWTLSSGGPDSSLYKSIDGGDTWVDITEYEGLPEGIKGKIGVAISPAKTDRVWAIVEAEEGGMFRSDDGGTTWTKLTDDRRIWNRPWYYMHVIPDPQDPETLYVLNVRCWKSIDGGRTFNEVTTPHPDNHDLWIDPRNPQRMIEGNDGGACVSFNGGESWSTIYNQMTGQFYHVATDNQFPYRLYGTQQDNSSISTPSRTHKGAILWGDSYPAGTGESGYIAVKPDDPNIVFVGAVGSSPGGGGALQRYDHCTGQIKLVTVWPEIYFGWGAKDVKYRFQWTFPILFSPHDPNVLYATGNVAFRSTDEGMSWEPISPDLTRNDVTKMEPSGGPITKDTTGAEHYGTIFAFAESPHQPGVFWAGSDDGLVHISRDGGQQWENITPPDLPEWSLISIIEASPHDPATAYVAATRYKLDDYRPMLYKTNDYGKTWKSITNGIPEHDFTRVIREDPARRGLLYVGTETGVYISFDDGESWQPFRLNLPVVPVHDLVIKDNDLVAATHGRSFWILDDITPLHQLNDQIGESPLALLKPRDTHRFTQTIGVGFFAGESGKNYHMALGVAATFYSKTGPNGESQVKLLDAGSNPPNGVVLHYYLREVPEDEITLTILDGQGREVNQFLRKPSKDAMTEEDTGPWLPVDAGMNRFVWNLQYAPSVSVPGDTTVGRGMGSPVAAPGTYQVQLKVGEQIVTTSFELLKDPRVTATQADLEAQLELMLKIRDKLSETHEGINQLRSIRKQITEWTNRIEDMSNHGVVLEAAQAFDTKLEAIEEELIQTKTTDPSDRLRLPTRLNAKLAGLTSVVGSSDSRPTQQAYAVFQDISAQIDEQLAQFRTLVDTDLEDLNRRIRDAAIPAIVPKPQT
ncbi:MAG: glycosyl hydrolase [Chloroflexota bacterium]